MKQINKMKMHLLSVLGLLIVGVSANAQLNGTYTVYGAGANYATLEAAASALSAGVSGPVIFKIRAGNWSDASTSDAAIGNVSGASATNTITFEAENGDPATTTITNTNTSSSTSENFIFYFNGAKYIRVRNLTLNKTHSTYGTDIRFAGDADYNIVEGCVLTGDAGTSTNSGKSRVYGTSMGSANNNTVQNNTINRGSYGIFWEGTSTSTLSQNNEFKSNTIVEPSTYGIYTYYTNNQKITNNTINTTQSGSFYAIYCYYGDGDLEIKNNTGALTGKTSTTAALMLAYCDGNSTNHAVVSGNDFTITTSSTMYTVYNQYCNWLTFDNNKVIGTTTSTGTMYMYPSHYGGNNTITNNTISSTLRRGFYFYGAYYSPNTEISGNDFTGISTDNASYTSYTYGMHYSNNSKFNGNKMTLTYGGSSYWYNYWTNYSSGCELNGNDIVEVKNNNSGFFMYNWFGNYANNLQIKNNKFKASGTPSYYWYSYFNNYGSDVYFEGNDIDITHNRGGSTIYSVYNYFYANGIASIKNNKIKSTTQTNGGFTYGLYTSLSSNTVMEIENNEIVANGNYVYGLYTYNYSGGNLKSIKNNAVYTKGINTNYSFMCYYPQGEKIYNNTFHCDGTSSNAYGVYMYMGLSQCSADFKNNSVTKTGGSGYALYTYVAGSASMLTADYNNYYMPSGNMFYLSTSGTSGSIQAWRTATGKDMNSLSYMPGFMNAAAGDLRPNPASPASWALNGRGVQISANDKDINGAARALTTLQGVPDIGAYEFTPTATPPDCDLSPATPVANGTQVVRFGQDTVAVLRWGNTVPTGFAVKQYTGTNPPGITTINPTQMFYYVDFQGTGTALDYEQDLYFKDPWLGTIASKSALRLAEKVGSGNWVGYSSVGSVSNITRNFINTPGVMNLQSLYTGIDVPNNASADAIIEPVQPFCPGTYTVKLRIKNNGNNIINNVKIAWQKDGGAVSTINHNTPININGSPQGNEAIITLGTVAFGNAGVNIKAWTFDPNNVTDPVPSDDTLNEDYFAALSGTYTVGGTTPNFPTVIAAADALTKYGTCGEVVFDIRPGTYTGKVIIDNPIRLNNATDKITFKAENGNANSVIISYSTNTNTDPTVMLKSVDYLTLKNLTINATGPTYGEGIALFNDCDNDSIIGCNINVAATLNTTYNAGIFAYASYTSFNGKDLVIKDNKIEGGYAACMIYDNNYSEGLVIDNNNIIGRVYCAYILYSRGMVFTNNTIVGSNAYSTNYGLMAQYAYNSPIISGNKISNIYYSAMYLYMPQGTSTTNRAMIVNNSGIMKPNTACYYPFMYYYGRNIDITNNTFVNNGNSPNYYAAYLLLSSYSSNKIYNNVFANLAGGPVFQSSFLSGYNNELDYNNLYTTSTTKFSDGTPSTASFAAWRTSTSQDKHSVSYDPAITSPTNPAPDVQNPAVWALNGHGVHIAGNNKDINGNTRVETRAAGVPDIGAYEVTPEVMPPLATATPASADPGDTQVFTFAGNEVGRIKWGMKAPTAVVEVRQYSGEKGNGIAAAAAPAGSMYFHTDVNPLGTGTTYDFDFNLDYMNIWMGDVASPSDLRLAHRVSGFPWMVYSGSLSSVDTTTKNVDASQLNRFGSYTALENNSVASSFVRAQGSTIICIGNSVQLEAEPKDGDYYKWYRNGVAIPGAEGISVKNYTASQAGDYSVAITFIKNGTPKIVESVPVTVSTIAAPNAIIVANKQLTYCVGNGLTLNAGNTTGVTYQWQLNGNDIPGATGSTHAVGSAGNYTVVAKNIGCATVSSVTPVTNGPLTVSLGNDTSYCEIKNVWMTLDAGYPGAKYMWNTGDTTKTIEVKQGGTYTVTVDGGPNCVGTDAIEVTIDPLPKANGISFVQNGNSYQFFPSGPVGASGFLWLFSDGTSSTQNNPTKVITGDLYVRLVMFNACGSDTVKLGWPLSVSNVADVESVQVYPNPAKDRVTISSTGVMLEEVEVLNSLGSVVYRGVVKGNSHSIEVSSYAAGHYMIRATTADGTITKQFDIIK